jgi:magnesium chelatase family protein
MSLARAFAVALLGLDGHLIEVVADLASGLPAFTITGLPDAALSEARDRVRAAVLNSGQAWPSKRITLGLSPASLRKSGSMFDLAMAAAVLAADGRVPKPAVAKPVLLGELGLDGRVRAVAGVLPAVLAAVRSGRPDVVVPAGNAGEAALVPGARVTAVGSLAELVAHWRGEPPPEPLLGPEVPAARTAVSRPVPDLADVVGQLRARRALEVGAAGGHHMFFTGPPGVGKTMLAERLPGLLPPLELDAALEVTAVHSLAGELPAGAGLIGCPPFRAPHHTASVAAVVGGGSGLARPGAVSLAHHGVLFLDEAPEFDRRALDALRQPLESGEITLSRASGTATYPARFLLVLAANPCACAGTAPDEAFGAGCTCSPAARRRYLARLSGPLLDRIDVRVQFAPVERSALEAVTGGESTAVVRDRVLEARARTRHRLRDTPWRSIVEVPASELRRRWPLPPDALGEALAAISSGRLGARGLHRIVRLAWTIADLDGAPRPGPVEVGEACFLRGIKQETVRGVRRSA